jgi:ZIP family zinc transporter
VPGGGANRRLLLVGALGGMLLHRGASVDTLAAVLSFVAAALLYLVTEELLGETHLPKETLLSTAMFFLGVLAILGFVVAGPACGR